MSCELASACAFLQVYCERAMTYSYVFRILYDARWDDVEQRIHVKIYQTLKVDDIVLIGEKSCND